MLDIKSLNEEQQQAVTHGQGPLLIIAGAGTGKTTVITKRIEYLMVKKNISPSNILALTFTEKAAQEMETRIDQVLPYGCTQMWIETFHAFCDRILRQEAIHIGLTPNFTLLKEAESLLFLRKHLFEFELEYFRPLGNPMKFLQGMLQHFSRLKDDDISPDQYLAFAKNLNAETEEIKKTMELARAFKRYEDLKAKEGMMDFSDLIDNTLKLFRTRKNILTYYQELFTYILVDEFQDTNYAQNELAILLAGEKQNITVVGDDDQSIYRWRGAAIANMIQFRSHFPKTKIVTLNKNYRSTQNILDSAYQLIQSNNPDRLEIKENINKKLESMRGIKGEEITFISTNRGEEEAEQVVKKIREEVKKTNRPYNEFAILVRANDHAIPFQRALERARIPYQFLGPGHLFQQEEIKDLIAYLHALANFEDTSSMYRVITLPVFALEARDIASLLNFAKRNNCSLFEAMEQVADSTLTENGKEKVTRIIEMMKQHLSKVPNETAGQILYYFFEDSGLLGHYLDPKSARTEKEAQNIAKFFEKLQSFASNKTDASVFAVVDWIDLSMELGESPLATEIDWTKNNAVNILTIHSSKGLEFPFVFVVNLVSQRFPSRNRKEQIPVPSGIIREELPMGDDNLQEERRLFYVAITRAKDKLFLSASRYYSEAKRERKISPFVVETLGETYVKNLMKKQEIQPAVQQLTLLDLFNAHIQNEKQTEPTLNSQFPILNSKITYISYSQLQTFLICPLHYKLRYILNVPTAPSPALSYGVSVHSSLRDFTQAVQSQQQIAPAAMSEILRRNWIALGYESKIHEQQSYQQAEMMLIEFARKNLLEKPDTVAIELPFSFWINTLKIGGRIDRIDRLADGSIEIIDYKTGPNVPTEKKVKEDFQLSFYALAATEIHDKIFPKTPDKIILSLQYLEANKKFSTTRSQDELILAKEKILSLVDDISKSDFHCSGGMFCKACEYKMLCQTFER
jgi:DNA helicase II / ATP-dependent DNA helicase PcrA